MNTLGDGEFFFLVWHPFQHQGKNHLQYNCKPCNYITFERGIGLFHYF
jgi:hypothetical protein